MGCIAMSAAKSLTRFVLITALLAATFVGRPDARQARTITATNCSQAAVQAAIASAVSGKAITLKAQFSRGVVITKNNSTSANLLDVTESSAGPVRISGLKFVGGT